MGYDQFERVSSNSQQRRLQMIFKKARESIGCEGAKAMSFEAKMIAEGLIHIQESIRATEAKIKTVIYSVSLALDLMFPPRFLALLVIRFVLIMVGRFSRWPDSISVLIGVGKNQMFLRLFPRK